MPEQRCSECNRDAFSGSLVCCDACAHWKNGVHSPECNARTFPEMLGAEYLDESGAPELILARLQKALVLASMLKEEFRVVAGAGRRFIPNYSSSLDTMIAHLQLDISYCESEARKLLQG